LIDYLAKNFGEKTPVDPPVVHPGRNLPATLLSGPSAKYVAMEFSLPQDAIPSAIAVDSQGIAWITERNTGMLGRFDAASKVMPASQRLRARPLSFS